MAAGWSECQPDACAAATVPLARLVLSRMSVFHKLDSCESDDALVQAGADLDAAARRQSLSARNRNPFLASVWCAPPYPRLAKQLPGIWQRRELGIWSSPPPLGSSARFAPSPTSGRQGGLAPPTYEGDIGEGRFENDAPQLAAPQAPSAPAGHLSVLSMCFDVP